MKDVDWESVGYFVFFGTIMFLGSMIVGAIGGLMVLLMKG